MKNILGKQPAQISVAESAFVDEVREGDRQQTVFTSSTTTGSLNSQPSANIRFAQERTVNLENSLQSVPLERQLPEPLSYTIEGAMHITGLGRSKLYQLLGEGVLAKVKVGRRTLIRADSVRALIGGAA